jgi:hypothetical protein
MCTLPEPAKSTTPMERESSTSESPVAQSTRKGDSQPCTQQQQQRVRITARCEKWAPRNSTALCERRGLRVPQHAREQSCHNAMSST